MPTHPTIGPRTSRRRISSGRWRALRSPLTTTEPGHISGGGGEGTQFAIDKQSRYAVRPRGNSVTHEDEMMKVASNQMDFEAVADLYTRSLSLIKLAIGKA